MSPPDDGTLKADWGNEAMHGNACTPKPEIGGWDCPESDFVYIHNMLPDRIVSGSRLLYGPVGVTTCSHYGGEPVVNIADTEVFWHTLPPGIGPWGGCKMDTQHGMECYVEPFVHFAPNGGCYRLDYTGDISLFKTNHFTLLNTDMQLLTGRTHRPRATDGRFPSWNVVLEIWYIFPGKINVYFNEGYVPPKGRANRVTTTAEGGANYFNPGSRI